MQCDQWEGEAGSPESEGNLAERESASDRLTNTMTAAGPTKA